jgi:thiol-disulfide isomerase/thioredoxin
MLERFAILAILALASGSAVFLARWMSSRRAARLELSDQALLWGQLGEQPDGRPALVVFSTPACVSCRTAQAPAVDAVRAALGETLRVLHVDIGERPDAAKSFKVLTAPSSAVLDRDGRLRRLNHGFASAQELLAQLAGADRPVSAPSPRRPGQPTLREPAQASRR